MDAHWIRRPYDLQQCSALTNIVTRGEVCKKLVIAGVAHPKLCLYEALLIAWIEANDSRPAAMIVHAADALKAFCASSVPYTQRYHSIILQFNLYAAAA